MTTLVVVNNPANWPLKIPTVEVVAARDYLMNPLYHSQRGTKIFNLCRSYRYQSIGYYVSLLAEARGHRPLPNVMALLDMKSPAMVRFVSDDLQEDIQHSLASIQGDEFQLSIYFGRNLAQRHGRLATQLQNLFQAPLLRAHFARGTDGWELRRIGPIAASEIPEGHRDFVVEAAKDYFSRHSGRARRRTAPRHSLAILANREEADPPSNEEALQRFSRAGESLGMDVERIEREDFGRLAEFDALFIRETTAVNHHTYRFARRAEALGLVVMDDPESILRCSNKVYLAELMQRHGIRTPKTWFLQRENLDRLAAEIQLPCVLKEPDSAFSRGVVKVETMDELIAEATRILAKSDLLVAQEFVPTDFDWRVGVLDRKPLYVCRYYMADKHWQIINHRENGKDRWGRFDTLPVEEAPRHVVRTAVRAANAVGDGLYGVDLKENGKHCHVIEVNDNPNLEHGVEDRVLKRDLYLRIMQRFAARIERRKQGW